MAYLRARRRARQPTHRFLTLLNVKGPKKKLLYLFIYLFFDVGKLTCCQVVERACSERLLRYLFSVRAGVQTRDQVQDVAEGHRVQVLDEGREKVVDVAAAVLQLGQQGDSW